MKSSEVIQALKSSIASTRSAGVQSVSLDDLETYASLLEETASKTPDDVAAGAAAMEAYKADLNSWISSRQQSHEFNLEMLRATIATGQAALKSALLINGGASVAMLAFIGNVWEKSSSQSLLKILPVSLAFYVFGVLVAAVASGFTYISQAGYGEEFGKASQPIGMMGHILAVLSVLISYSFFGWESWLAYTAMCNG